MLAILFPKKFSWQDYLLQKVTKFSRLKIVAEERGENFAEGQTLHDWEIWKYQCWQVSGWKDKKQREKKEEEKTLHDWEIWKYQCWQVSGWKDKKTKEQKKIEKN